MGLGATAAGDDMGWPCFLRTDRTSGQHNWSRTCYFADAKHIPAHVGEIVLLSEMVGLSGCHGTPGRCGSSSRPSRRCVPHFGDMPVCREFRFFVVVDGAIKCGHEYWPRHAPEQGGAELVPLAEAAGKAWFD